jgi:hypothetical protein
MNSEIYYDNLKKDPAWDTKNCTHVPLEVVSIVDDGGQVRQGGTQNSHIAALKESIFDSSQKVPITVLADPTPEGKWEVVEGNHRLKALRALKSENPLSKSFGLVWIHKKKFTDEAERVKYQLQCNDHLPAKSSSHDDYALALYNQLNRNEGCDGITWKNFNSCDKNTAKLVDWMKEKWGLNKNTGKAVVKAKLAHAPGSKLINYSKDEVINLFGQYNSFGWSGKEKEKCNGYVVYAVGRASHIFPNATGNSFKRKTDDGRNTETIVVGWMSNTVGQYNEKLKAYRKAIVDKANHANASWLLAAGVTVIDEIVFVPQTTTEKKKNKLLTCVKDSNGAFTTKFA